MTRAHEQCSTSEHMLAFLQGQLDSTQEDQLQSHLDGCVDCRQLLSSTAADDAAWIEAQHFFSGDALHEDLSESRDTSNETVDEQESIVSLLKLLGPTDDPRMLGRIGPYEIVGVLGRGGMGVVFKAYEPSLNRYVAIKLLLPHLAASGAARMRFAREGRAAAAVIDDNVLPIFSVAEWQGVPYLVTQLSRGTNLQKRINESGPLELREILRLGMQASSGSAAAHAQGLVHRDVKPSNILLDGTVDRALLTDFGLARAVDDASITCSGIIAGTPQYMSPEQALGGTVDARSDLFGLGSVLYTMCTGRPPFRAENSFAVLRLITDVHPRAIREINPDIPEWLCAIIRKLMSKQAEDRYQSAGEVSELLSACLAHVQQPTAVDLPSELLETTERSRLATRYWNIWRGYMPKYITYHIPQWFPSILFALIAFALSLKPAMSLATLPKESFLHSVPPMLAVLTVTSIGFVWGLAITFFLKRISVTTDSADRRTTLYPTALFAVGGAIVFVVLAWYWFRQPANRLEELTDAKKQFVATTAGEQTEQGNLAANVQQSSEIIGYLRNDTGEPIRNATIACSSVYDKAGRGGGANAITDAEGRYRLSGLEAGIYTVWLKHYENPHFTAIADDGVEVIAGQPTTSTLSLVPTIHVTGLLKREGKPATTGTAVLCYCNSRPESSATALTALTDEQGRFSFDLPRGRASFIARGRSQGSNVLLVAKSQIFVGQAKGPASEPYGDVLLDLSPQRSQFGSTDWLDRATPGTEVLERKTADDITGTIVDTEGKPIEMAKVFTEANLNSVVSDKEGVFRFPKAKGTQTIMRVFKPGYHIWLGLPTAGDRLKVVLEKKETNLNAAKDKVEISFPSPETSDDETVVQQDKPPLIPFVEIADLHPGLDKQEVTMAFIIDEEYLITGSVPVGHVPSFGIKPQLKPDRPQFSVLVSGDCADALSRSGLGPDLNKATGVGIQATGRLVVFPPAKDHPNDQPTYQLNISDWKKCRVIAHNPQADENGQAENNRSLRSKRPPVTCVLLQLNEPGTIEVEVSVGLDDGITLGDKLDAIQDGEVVGKVEIIQAEASRSKAHIIEVVPGKALDRGDTVESPMFSPANAKGEGVRLTIPAFDFKVGVLEESKHAQTVRMRIPSVIEAPVVWNWKHSQGKINDEVFPLQFSVSLVR